MCLSIYSKHIGAQKLLILLVERLQRELPGLRGFSSGNLKKMRIFYEEWQCLSIGSPMANQLQQKLILIWVTRRIFLGLRQSEALLLGNSK